MEDDLKKMKWKTTSKKYGRQPQKMEDDLKKMENNHKYN
jgi:hypothetical protein